MIASQVLSCLLMTTTSHRPVSLQQPKPVPNCTLCCCLLTYQNQLFIFVDSQWSRWYKSECSTLFHGRVLVLLMSQSSCRCYFLFISMLTGNSLMIGKSHWSFQKQSQ